MNRRKLVGGALLVLTASVAYGAEPAPSTQPSLSATASSNWVPPLMLGELSQLNIVSVAPWNNLSVLPIDSPPINGFVPQVVFGLTDQQQSSGNQDFFSVASSSPGGNTLPKNQTVKYDVAILDSGSQSHLITATAYGSSGFNIPTSGREGTEFAQIAGASGIEDVIITDALGVYAVGINNASVNSGVIGVTPGTLRGQWNTAILGAQAGSSLPNIIGAPIIAQYQTVIRNSQTRHITLGNGSVVRSPSINFQTLNTALPSNYSRLTLDVMGANGVSPNPNFISFSFSLNPGDNPTAPTWWGSMLAKVNANGSAGGVSNEQFLFDTGAQVTVVSQDTAASCGFYSGGPNPSTPDFTVEVAGVGGATEQVPGFYMDHLSVMTNGGPISWNHVPVIVLDVPDPRDAIGYIPGILGMNLFTDRDLILNGGFDNPYVAISPQIIAQWTATGGGTWSDDTKWSLGSPDNADTPANFLSSITSAATITVDAQGFTVGSMKFDNPNRYTIAGPGTINFLAQSTGQSSISVLSGSHTISAPINLQSDTNITITPPTSTLTISSGVSGAGTAVTKLGAGTLETLNVRTKSLNVSAGRVYITPGGTNASTSRVQSLAISPGGSMDLTNAKLIIDYTTLGTASSDLNQELYDARLISSFSDASHRLGYLDNAGAGLGSFGGLTIDSTSLLVSLALTGDANLDGTVNSTDLGMLANSWNSGHGYWYNGDFNYDGLVNVGDLLLLANNWQAASGGASLSQAMAALGLPATAVPEPGAAFGLSLLALSALSRRQRRA